MRISDWSSDVCSSDLTGRGTAVSKATAKTRNGLIAALDIGTTKCCCFIARPQGDRSLRVVGIGHQESRGLRNGVIVDMEAAEATIIHTVHRSEEHTSELQSLMRISYAVFCLKKQTH